MSPPWPSSIADFSRVFPDETACRDYLIARRWPDGFICPACGHARSWQRSGNRFLCRGCRRETSVTAGTVLHRSHLPLLTWFWSAYLVATLPGLNARILGRQLNIPSHRTRWLLLDRLRASMSALALPSLGGFVEADEMALVRQSGAGRHWRWTRPRRAARGNS